MNLRNTTHLDSGRLEDLFLKAIDGWSHDGLDVAIRPSRGADFSGSCHYVPPRIYVNIGRHNRYPYLLRSHIARARSDARSWWRELYTIELSDAYELVLFIFLHEFYHWLIRRARRNGRQKESRCDRFAARVLVGQFGAVVRDVRGRDVPRSEWDFQDLDGFVAAARLRPKPVRATATPIKQTERSRPLASGNVPVQSPTDDYPARQLWLFQP